MNKHDLFSWLLPLTSLFSRLHVRSEKRMNDACVDGFIAAILTEWNTSSFEKMLARAAEQTPFPLRIHVEKMLHRVREKGMSMDESLELFSKEYDTSIGTRTMGLLRHAYKNGCTRSTREAFAHLGEDVREHVRVEWKTYANKLVVYSLVFIGISALVPALFLAFVTIGSRFLELSLTPTDILLTTFLIFPLLDLGVLAGVHLQKPPTPRMAHSISRRENQPILEYFHVWKKRLNEIICLNGNPRGVSGMMYTCTLCAAGLFIICWTIYVRNPEWGAFWASTFLVAIAGPFLAYGMWHIILFEKNTQTMEKQAGEALLILSSIPHTESFVSQLEWVATISRSPLRETWKKMTQWIQKGKNPTEAFELLFHARNSSILESVSSLLKQTYESGNPFGTRSRELAQKIATHHSSLHERRSVLLVEKYTILVAGGILVPFLLGILTGVVSSLPFTTHSTLLPEGADALFTTALHGVRGYLILYACIAGLFVGMQEDKWGEGVAYSLILLPSAQIVYMLGSAWMT